MTMARRIAVYGGSFNPVHLGHTMIAGYVARRADVDAVWFMVSPENPLKAGRLMASEADRLAMARLAARDIPGVWVSDFELTLPRPSYSYLTLTGLREAYPDCRFRMIIGADNWLDFEEWRNPREIIEEFGLIVYPRPGLEIPHGFRPAGADISKVTFLSPDAPLNPASSTAIREALANGADPASLPVDPEVADYIRSHALYR